MTHFETQKFDKFRDALDAQKEAAIKEALSNKGMKDLAFFTAKGRFPMLVKEINYRGDECYFAADGSIDGIFIISFSKPEFKLNNVEGRLEMSVTVRSQTSSETFKF